MRRIFFFVFFILIFFFTVFSSKNTAQVAFCAQNNNIEHDWVWNVSVIPPPEGWNSEPGKSISNALAWSERDISESSSGAGGHDIKFTKLEWPLSTDILIAARNIDFKINSHTVAVISFGDYEVDKIIVNRMAGNLIPLFLAGGENILIDRNGRPLSNIFALDLFRDYRSAAFAAYAKKIFKPDAKIALAASRFTVNQEREAKICYSLLDSEGFIPMPFWADASVQDSYAMMSEEVESSGAENAGVMISFMGSMGAREIWRNFMRLRSGWKLWNCSAPEESYLSCRGMILADQNVLLDKLGGFIEVKRRLWSTRATPISNNVAAGRVLALTEWLKRGVDALPQPVDNIPRASLLRNLERVSGISFGNQILNISPRLHRPYERNVFIVEVRNREYQNIDTISTKGLAYSASY